MVAQTQAERSKRYRERHPELFKCTPEKRAYQRQYQQEHKEEIRLQKKAYHKRLYPEQKCQVLTHYGLFGRLCCCWTECGVTDIDLLTLDHLNNTGGAERRIHRSSIYSRLLRDGLPEGYQTLCWNHQWKKRLLVLREEESRDQGQGVTK
jgi:hypothetical protein